jgi:outer membrane protein assembly factor BamB
LKSLLFPLVLAFSGSLFGQTLLDSLIEYHPYAQQGGKLVGTGAAGNACQGSSVGISSDGNTAIVGACYDSGSVGAVWVFTRSGGVWSQQGSKLVGLGAVGASMQGISVAISSDGNTAIVGGMNDNGKVGATWIFTRTGGVWSQQGNKLVGTGAVGPAQQGSSVGISSDGNTAIIGGLNDNGNVGAAWVFTRSGGVWGQQGSKLVGTGAVGDAWQGGGVALSGDGNTALVGGPNDNNSVGGAWVFTRSGSVWAQQGNKLVGTGGVGASLQSGVSLSGDGNTAIVGGPNDDNYQGAVWVFKRSGGTWGQQGNKLVGAGSVGSFIQQGYSVSLSSEGNTLIESSPCDSNVTGAVWVFARSGGVWSQQGDKLVGRGAVGNPRQGQSASLSPDGSTLIVGGTVDNTNTGAAWVFVRSTQLNLSAVAQSRSVALSWSIIPEKNYLRYRVYRGEGSPATAVYDSVSGNTFGYLDGGLQNGVTYSYRVAAVDSGLAESLMSQEVTATPRLQLSARTVLSGAGGPITGLSLLGDSTLYVVASGDAIYRINLLGAVDYTLQVGGNVNSSSSISDDSVVYIASSDKNVYAFSNGGLPLWPALPLGGVMSTTPTIDESAGMIYVGVENKNFVAANRSTGRAAWSFFADAPVRSSAVITSDHMLVFSTVVGTIYALDLNNFVGGLPLRYTLSAGDSILGSPAIDPGGAIYFPALHGKSLRVRIDRGSGISLAWQQTNGPAVRASLVIDGGGTLYLASLDSMLYAIDTASGSVKWSHKTSGAFESTPTISTQGMVYVGNTAGEVIALDGLGTEQWYYKDSASIVSPLLYDQETLYAGTASGKIVALHDSSLSVKKVLAGDSPAWLTFQGSNRRTGNQSDATVLSVNPPTRQIPLMFRLDQNYPNPFNPTTTIRYELPQKSQLTLSVYNVLGQQVATLVNREEEAGHHEVKFDGSNLSSGVYFYRLQAGSFVETRKLLLLK